jgi:uncharacterized delta-60 repeat protein
VTFTVTDDGTPVESDSEAITITVNHVNLAPVLDPVGDWFINEGQLLQFTVSASDPDTGDTLTYSATNLPIGATFDPLTQVFTWTPDYTQAGTYANVTFTVTDDGTPTLSDSEAITITVNDVNQAPILNPIGDKSVNEGELLQFTVTASDLDGHNLTYSASNLPAGASFSAGTFTWTPNYTDAGTYPNVTFVVIDDGTPILSDSETITITVNDVNRAPVLNPIGDKTVDEGQLLQFTVTASDPDGDTLTYSATNLPTGASFDPLTQIFSWVPDFTQTGSYPNVTFTVTDDGTPNLSDSEAITITVGEVNRPPVLDPIGDKAVDEGQLLQFTVTASDPDTGDTLTYSATNLPAGGGFDPLTQVFTWTPDYTQAGSYTNVTFTVTDDGTPTLSDSEAITITVSDINQPPVLDPIGAKTVDEAQLLQFTVSASDPDGNNLTLTASNLPGGATFSDNGDGTGLFTWTPNFTQAGAYPNVTFTVTDDGTPVLNDSEAINITVNDVNGPPVLNPIGDKTVDEAQLLQFTVSASDPNGDNLTLTASNLPGGATFTDNGDGTGLFTWTPNFTQAGAYPNVIFVATDDGTPQLSDTEAITITVNDVNRAPVLIPIGDKTVDEGQLLQFTVAASDPDGNNLTLTASNLPGGATFTDNGDGTGLFTWTPDFTQAGSYPNVTFTVTDDGTPVLNDLEAITITVDHVNQPPVLDPIGDKTGNEGELLAFVVTASDQDGDNLTYAASNLPAGASFYPLTQIFTWTPDYTQAGSYPNVTFTVTDDGTPVLNDSEVITITVNDVNRAPVLDPIGDQTVSEGQLLQLTVTASDPDGNNLTYSAGNVPTGASFDPLTQVFTWTPDYGQQGTYPDVTFTVTDDGTPVLNHSEAITITVTPELPPVADFCATPTGGLYPLTVTFTDASTGTVNTWAWDFGDGIGTSTERDPMPYTYDTPGTYTVSLTVTGPVGSDSETKIDYILVVSDPADWYVDGGVASSGDGTDWTTAFKTITEGINAASPGDTINVTAGTYNERLVIDKRQLTLTGAGSDYTIVQPTDVPTAGVYDVEIDASGTIIQGFQFDFNGTDDTRSGNGIAVSDVGEAPVTHVQILKNKIYTGHANTAIQTGRDSDVSGLIIKENIFYGDLDGTGEGVYVHPYTGCGDVTISTNEFYGYLFSAVSIESSNVQVTGNMVDSDAAQGAYGVRFIDPSGGKTYGNVLIAHNRIENVQQGISIGTSTDVGSTLQATIDSNTLSSNDIGLQVQYGVDLIITNNTIAGNTNYGLVNDGTALVVAENNWWGDVSGPYHPTTNPGGTGDVVGDNVDYDPWSVESLPIAEFSGSPTTGVWPLTVQFTDLTTGTVTYYLWEFGDGQTSNEQNPSHEYQAPGNYTVRLEVSGPAGSTYRGKVNYIRVSEHPPVSDFTATPTTGPEPLFVQFLAQNTGGPVTSYYWEFGDGGTSTRRNPSYGYSVPGDYTVRLTVTGPGGTDVEEKIDYIHVDYAAPVADFTASPTSAPAGTDVQFTDLSTNTVTDYYWEFGDTQTSTEQNPVHQYQTSGTYTVRLTVTGPGGTDVMEKINYIYVGPVADFTASPTIGDGPLDVQFTDLSLGTVTDYYWEFGDTQTSTAQHPLHQYQSPGDYTVRLTVTGPYGSDMIEKTDYIRVKEPAPVADFTATPTTGILPLAVQFTDLSSGVVTDYYWEFGDGQTSTAQNPVHQYQTAGDYTVQLTTNGPDYSDVMVQVDYIHVGELKWWTTAYGHPDPAIPDQAKAIDNTADGGYIAAGKSNGDVWVLKLHTDGVYLAWERTYGGTADDEAHAIRQTADGNYIVAGMTSSFGAGNRDIWVLKLSANGDIIWQKTYGGTADDEAYAIQQTADGGYVVAGATSSAGAGNKDIWVLKLDADGNVGLAYPGTWQKTYGDTGDDEAYAVQQTPGGEYIVAGMKDYLGPGSGDVWLLKLDADGNVGTAYPGTWQKTYGDAAEDKAYSVQPTADGGYVVAGTSNDDMWVLKVDADGNVGTTYPGTWQKTYGDTGDDQAYCVQQTPDGGYVVAGSTSSLGNGGYDTWILKLSSDGTVAWENTYGGTEDDRAWAIQLTPDDEYVVAGQTESFGNGSAGYPDVWFLRLDQDGEISGCNNIILVSNAVVTDSTVLPQDTSAFTQDTSVTPADTPISPQNISPDLSTLCWEFVIPEANFTADPVDGKNPLTVQCTDLSTGDIASYLWNFGDGNFSTDRNPVHQYVGMGIYPVKLTVTGPAGSDWKRIADYINVTEGLPIPDFTANPTVGTPRFIVTFYDQSSEEFGSIDIWQWDFGDGNIGFGKNISHTYIDDTVDAWTVSLTVTGPGGSATETKVDYIRTPDYAAPSPVINRITNRVTCQPGGIFRIIGQDFGASQGNSVIHLGNRYTYDATSPKIKLWSDTNIKMRMPFTKKSCAWFKHGDGAYRVLNVWVTVDGDDSNKKRMRLLKPDTCP